MLTSGALTMPRYKLTLEYAGTRYSGWQIQKNARTVQGELHAPSARRRSGHVRDLRIGPHRRGRARARPRSRTSIWRRRCRRRRSSRASTTALPHDINVLAAERVPPRFHARHSAVARSYLYQIAHAPDGVRQAVRLVGAGAARPRRDAGRGRALAGFARLPRVHRRRPGGKIDAACWSTTCRSRSATRCILVRVVGSHFLWKMVRRLVGVLVEVGRGETAARTGRRLADQRLGPAARSSPRRRRACFSSASSTRAIREMSTTARPRSYFDYETEIPPGSSRRACTPLCPGF